MAESFLSCQAGCSTATALGSARHVVGIDVGVTSGWCLMHAGADGILRSWSGQRKFSGTCGERFVQLFDWLIDSGSWLLPDLMVFEEHAFNRGATGFSLNGMTAVLMLVAEKMSVPYVGVNTKTLKKFAVKGDASKADMQLAAFRSSGRAMGGDEADAYFLARYGVKQVLPALSGDPGRANAG